MLEQVIDMNYFNLQSSLTPGELIIKNLIVIVSKLLLLRAWWFLSWSFIEYLPTCNAYFEFAWPLK